jgi:hypothetical protein
VLLIVNFCQNLWDLGGESNDEANTNDPNIIKYGDLPHGPKSFFRHEMLARTLQSLPLLIQQSGNEAIQILWKFAQSLTRQLTSVLGMDYPNQDEIHSYFQHLKCLEDIRLCLLLRIVQTNHFSVPKASKWNYDEVWRTLLYRRPGRASFPALEGIDDSVYEGLAEVNQSLQTLELTCNASVLQEVIIGIVRSIYR